MASSQFICTVDELVELQRHDATRLIDASWYMPSQQIDTEQQYQQQHIPGAVFFDIDRICDPNSDLPHMLPSETDFSDAMTKLGISNTDSVIVYDSAGLFSAARLWWMLKVFGHDQVRVLNGGLPAWVAANQAVSEKQPEVTATNYHAQLDASLVANKHELITNCESGECIVLDARAVGRFTGEDPEPRPGLPSGHMPQSLSLPYDRLITNGKLRPANELKRIFSSMGVNHDSQIITSCGSGVTAAIISLGMCEAGLGMHRLYDGAWSEWASAEDTTILSGIY